MKDKYDILNTCFGYSSFKKGQEDIINALLSGRDALGVLPTGAGKSLCYQLPAIMFSGLTVVISPLISLMQDQVFALNRKGIGACFINSLTQQEDTDRYIKNILKGKIKLLYIAPERLFSYSVRFICKKVKISMVAVDEAHCVSQWGQDFRPSYLKINEFISSLSRRPVICALTATATKRVREDIVSFLKLNNPEAVITSFNRENLYFEVCRPIDKSAALKRYIDIFSDRSGIIYCSSRKTAEEVCRFVLKEGYNAQLYHGGMNKSLRKMAQDAFIRDESRIVVATNAFGMGIDKADVSFIIHYNMPGDVESYYQEAGRAGRNGKKACCILFYNSSDEGIHRYFINNAFENEELTAKEKAELRHRKQERLEAMIAYCKCDGCLRRYILSYFGEDSENCGNCSYCIAQGRGDYKKLKKYVLRFNDLSAKVRLENLEK